MKQFNGMLKHQTPLFISEVRAGARPELAPTLIRARENGSAGGLLDLRGEQLRLHVYLDHSIIETYANGLKSLTTRVYPTGTDALGLQV